MGQLSSSNSFQLGGLRFVGGFRPIDRFSKTMGVHPLSYKHTGRGVIDTRRWIVVVRPWKIRKSITMVDLYYYHYLRQRMKGPTLCKLFPMMQYDCQ